MTRHLVTGGAGFIGSALVKRLLAEGHDVAVLDRLSRGKADRLHADAEIFRGDIRDLGLVSRAAKDADTIWHLAYVQGTQTFYADPRTVIDVALTGVINMLTAAEGADANVMLISSSEAYQIPPSFPTDETVPLSVPDVTNPRYSYGAGKIASEVAALAYARSGSLGRVVIIRPHNIIGPDMGEDHVVPQLARRVQDLEGDRLERLEIQGDGTATRCFCYIDDAIDGLLVAYEKGEDCNVYHLGNAAEEVSITELALMIAAYYGRRVDLDRTELPSGSPTRRVPDVSKLEAIGYMPLIPLSVALGLTLAWYKQ
jgi:nucleoside-diphosphate-sugar epimerase